MTKIAKYRSFSHSMKRVDRREVRKQTDAHKVRISLYF